MGSYGIPPLPEPPRPSGPAQYAPQGNMAPGPSPNPYVLPYRQPMAPTLIDGINKFLDSWKQQRQADQQRNASLFDKDIQNINLGIPVDLKKTAKYAKRSGLNIDFEGTAANPAQPATPPSTAQGAPQQQQLSPLPDGSQMPAQTVPGGSVPMPGTPATAGTPYQPGPQQSFMQQLLTKMGARNPQINPQSPGMNWLQQQQALGQMRAGMQPQLLANQQKQVGLQGQQIDNEAQKQLVLGQALTGNPQALELATRLDMLKDLPADDLFRIGRKLGMTEDQISKQAYQLLSGYKPFEMQKMYWEEASKLAARMPSKSPNAAYNFLMDPANAKEKPGFTAEEEAGFAQKALELKKEHPGLSFPDAYNAVLGTVYGNADQQKAVSNYLGKFQDQQQWENHYKQLDYGLQVQKFAEAVSEFRTSHELAVGNAIREALGPQMAEYSKMMQSSDPAIQATGVQLYRDAASKLNAVQVKLPNGQSVSIGPGDLQAYEQPTINPFVFAWRAARGAMGLPNPMGLRVQSNALGPGVPDPTGIGATLKAIVEPPAYLKGENLQKYQMALYAELTDRMKRAGFPIGENKLGDMPAMPTDPAGGAVPLGQ